MSKTLIPILILALLLSGCGSAPKEKDTTESQQQTESASTSSEPIDVEPETTVPAQEDTLQYSFRSYSITVPESWAGLYAAEQGDDSISFYEKQDYERNGTGFLFSLSLHSLASDYDFLPSYKLVGDINENGTNNFEHLIATYPTDVQYDTDTVAIYQEMQNDIDTILKSVTEAPGYTFYLEEEQAQETADIIYGDFIGNWNEMLVGSSAAPDGATAWFVEFCQDGTGAFTLQYEHGDSDYLPFTYSVTDTSWPQLTKIIIPASSGPDLCYLVSFTWSNQMQKTIMTMYDGASGMPDGAYWMFTQNK